MTARPVALVLAVALGVAAGAVFFWQVEVGDPSRACGSAFDAVADRSGWEVWWAQDLDEATTDRPSELVRTTRCPDAVNRRTVGAAVLGGAALAAVLAAGGRRPRSASSGAERFGLERVGTVATGAGLVLFGAGVSAIVLLVADSDSTLFLYTDRLVVAVVGLIALVPALALALGGWALRVASRSDGAGDDD